ncbi:MAG: phenylalanine--tRNA ligase beta subunit-related protein [Solirubrobacteraceae bacterium]|jgi:DNA/RNA-binding domain of Phe-tRNA-synthetase-like protein
MRPEPSSGRERPEDPPQSAFPESPDPALFAPAAGWCAREVQEELPGLGILTSEVHVARARPLTGSSPHDIRERLRALSNRFRGAKAVAVRREPIPAAYRVFFRQIGLDPDVERTPIEGALLERMLRGGFLPAGLLEDALLIGLLDTGVPVWALDAESLEGPLGVRLSGEGERLGRSADAPELPPGRLVLADASAPLAILFGEVAAAHRPGAGSERLALFAVQVAGVPSLYVEEALWTCRSALEQP